MKKIFKFVFFISILLLFNTLTFANNFVNLTLKYDNKIENYTAEKVHIFIEDKEINNFKMEPIILNGRVLVPLRDVFESMNANVFWNNEKRKVTVEMDNKKISFLIDSNWGMKNETEKFYFDVPAKIINNFTMIPIRAVSNALDYNVSWDNSLRRVTISKNNDIPKENNSTENFAKKDGIKIVWDQIGSTKGNDAPGKRNAINGLDVISPTWFAIKDENGTIEDKGSLEYAKWAKEQGYQIWALITNSFNPKITHAILSDSTKRQKLINDIVVLAKKYNLDGINIDFESIAKEDGDYYLQFIKEATPIFKQNNLVVSVDMYVPQKWTAHYHMKEVGEIVDYVIIMAYDEHHRNSKESGSVSSIPWADLHMKKATELVDKNKLIMGIPFYTRVWTETKDINGNTVVSSKSLKMDEAINLLNQNNAQIIWDEKTSQYYGEYTLNGTVNKIWLEEEKSIEERMKIATKYDIKGVAFWKRGHEKANIWDIINKYYE